MNSLRPMGPSMLQQTPIEYDQASMLKILFVQLGYANFEETILVSLY
jgi:hypothetical protein